MGAYSPKPLQRALKTCDPTPYFRAISAQFQIGTCGSLGDVAAVIGGGGLRVYDPAWASVAVESAMIGKAAIPVRHMKTL